MYASSHERLLAAIGEPVLVGSPIHESLLDLFSSSYQREALEAQFGIPARYIPRVMSPWAAKRLQEYDGDIRWFKVVKLYPSILKQVAMAKTEPGDENNQDISSLVGKVDIRKLEEYSQDDTDAYSYSGGRSRGTQGILEFVEMFKAPIKTLNPRLTATQEGNYKGTEGLSAIPFNGIILAHSNESEEFRNNRRNEAFINRVNIVKVPCVNRQGDRTLTLRHRQVNRRPLDDEKVKKVLKFTEELWGFPVEMELETKQDVSTAWRVEQGSV